MLQIEPHRVYESKFNEMFMVCVMWWLLMISFHFCVVLKQCFCRVTDIYGYSAFSRSWTTQKVPVIRCKMRCVHYSLLNEIWIQTLKFASWRGKHPRYLASFECFWRPQCVLLWIKAYLIRSREVKTSEVGVITVTFRKRTAVERTCKDKTRINQ